MSTWQLHSSDHTGLLILTDSGHFATVTVRNDLPAFASGDRRAGTAEEYRAIVAGSDARYGTHDGTSLQVSGPPHHSGPSRFAIDGDMLTERRDDGTTFTWERAPAQIEPGGVNQVAGVWWMASAELHLPSGEVEHPYTEDAAGYLIFTADGWFVDVLHRPDLGTGDAEIVQGSFAVFGRYSVDDEGAFFDETLVAGTFPNWNGLSRDTSQITETVTGQTMLEELDIEGGAHLTIGFTRVD